MTDFSHLEELQVTADKTKEYPIIEIGGEEVLILRSANEGNPGYMNGLLRLSGQGKGQRRAKLRVDAESMDLMREHDKELYPDHVIVGWKGIKDSAGKEVPFSKKEAAGFITALPNWIFDGIRGFANDPENFVVVIDSATKAGN